MAGTMQRFLQILLTRTRWLTLVISAIHATSAIAAMPNSLDLGVSAMSYQMNKLAQDDAGKTETMGSNFYHFQVQYHAALLGRGTISPLIRYMPESLSAVKAPDGGSTSSIVMLGVPLISNLSPHWDIGGGPALLRYTIHGLGGTKVLNNGTSQTTFALPGETVTSTSLGILFGGAFYTKEIRTALDLFLQAPFSAERRTMSLILSFTGSVYSF